KIFIETLLKTAKQVQINGESKLITPPAVIVVPSKDLLKQVYDELHADYPQLMVGKRYGDEKTLDIEPLTITIYNTYMNDIQSGFIVPGDIKLAVLDEAHRGLSTARAKELDKLKGTVFFDTYSASPAFDANKSLYELLGKECRIEGPTDRQL